MSPTSISRSAEVMRPIPLMFLAALILLCAAGNAARAGDLPIGIPAPSFGFVESHEMYATDQNYQLSPAGPYTHYVDNSDANCSNFLNDGTVARPRCAIPTDLDAGDVVEIHGGGYITQSDWNISVAGTRTAPVFIRGVDDGNGFPMLESENAKDARVNFSGTYGIIEDLQLFELGIRVGDGASSDHLGVRNLDISWHDKSCVTIGSDYSVISDSEMHHCRDGGRDRHGLQVLPGVNFSWILNNEIHHNSGNGIQYAHGAQDNPPDYVFIGGNHIYSDREVGIATKWAKKTIVSSNVIHSYRSSQEGVTWCFDDDSGCMVPASATNGPGIIIGADGFPEEKWIIYNLIYDSNHCIRNEKVVKARIIGNVCANIQGVGLGLEKLGEDMFIVNNTFYRTGLNGSSGVFQQDFRDQFDLNVQNNLILSPGARALWFESIPVTNKMEFNNNMLWNGGSDMGILWNNSDTQIGSEPELRSVMLNGQSAALEMSGNLVTDPGLSVRDSPTLVMADFAPAANSPLVGAGSNVLLQLDAEFKQTFGPGVTVIPPAWSDNSFDIGAVPEGVGQAVVAPMPPILDE